MLRIILKASIFILCLIGFNISTTAQNTLSSDAQISLLTCDPGQDIYTLFGHSAIWVQDRENGINEVFNYGVFDFNTPNFIPKFLRGKLLYWVAKQNVDSFFGSYNSYKRRVRANQILLDSIQMNNLYSALIDNALPANKDYYYDFFFDNCSTRIDDIISNKVGKIQYPEVEPRPFRSQLHEYLKGRDWTAFGIDLIIGSRADKPTKAKQQMFLPDYLQGHLENSKFSNGRPVMGKAISMINHPLLQACSFWITPIFLFTLLLILEIFILGRKREQKWIRYYDNLWMALMAIASIILMFMWFCTDHKACGLNYNLVTFSPFIILWMVSKKFFNNRFITVLGLLIIIPMILLPFIKVSVQNVPSSTLLIALITAMKIFRNGKLSSLRKWV